MPQKITLILVASLGVALFAGSAAGVTTLARNGGHGGTPNDPITEVGDAAKLTAVVVKFPDGTGEVVYTDRPATLETGAAVLAERVAAENRPASHGVLASRRSTSSVSRRRSTEGWGSSVCSVGQAIVKTSSTTVQGQVASSCTGDVTWQGVTMYLYRSANYTLIASGSKSQNGPYMVAATGNGTCLSSTWQYNLQTFFNAVSSVNGSVSRILWFGPQWVTC